MTIRILRDFQTYHAGQILSLPEHEEGALIDLGVAGFEPSSRFVGDIPILARDASFTSDGPRTIDEATRTVDVVMSTGAPVIRRDWLEGDYIEELEISPKAIRMDRLNNAAPLLDSHDISGGVGAILGSVVPGSARIERGALWGRVRFSSSDRGERAFRDVKDGILRSVSVGYITHKYATDDTTSPPTRRATDWEVYELSAVAIPADATAGFRSLNTGSQAPGTASPARMAWARMEMAQRAANGR